MEWFLQGLVITLMLIAIGISAISVIRRQKISLVPILINGVVIILCISDAILRGSWWPLGTAITLVAVIWLQVNSRRNHDISEMAREDQDRRARLHEEDLREKEMKRWLQAKEKGDTNADA